MTFVKLRLFSVVAICVLLIQLAPIQRVAAGTLVQFRTTFGDIEVELYDQDKPVTVHNFLRYVESGRYKNEFCHRLEPGFVLQGGGFTLSSNNIYAVPTYAPITNEFHVGKFYSNDYGTIAMAKTSDPNSATSQFFFNLADNSALLDDTNNSGGFTVFGHVIKGTNVLQTFNAFQYYSGSQQSNVVANLTNYFGLAFLTCPLLHPSIYATNLVFLDITLLQVAIQPAAGGREISWNSTSGMTNIVEYTTNLPPVWNTLVSTNGDGSRMSVVDTTKDPKRFYRVRVAN